jgi:hypothetical protein
MLYNEFSGDVKLKYILPKGVILINTLGKQGQYKYCKSQDHQ